MTYTAYVVDFDTVGDRPACVIRALESADKLILIALYQGELSIARREKIEQLTCALAIECSNGYGIAVVTDPKVTS